MRKVFGGRGELKIRTSEERTTEMYLYRWCTHPSASWKPKAWRAIISSSKARSWMPARWRTIAEAVADAADVTKGALFGRKGAHEKVYRRRVLFLVGGHAFVAEVL